MSQFEYILPSGSRFKVTGPAEATQAQADRVFYEQVVAGSLVGYESGQTLTSLASRVTKFELSRLERGIAGIDSQAVLSIVQNLPVVSGIPELANVPILNPVDQSDIVLARGDDLGPLAVGPLTAFQTQTLQAQLSNLVDQDYTEITQEKGIGKFGFNCSQLEQAGYVKPGTYSRCLASSPEDFVEVMNSPAIWTGLGGVDSLDDLLNDVNTQNKVQNQLMEIGYNALTATGVISNVPQSSVSFSQGKVYTPSGLQTLNALNTLGGTSGLITNLLGQPVSNLSTIASGILSNNVLAQTATNIAGRITGDVGALINNASKFGSLATSAWAKSGGVPNVSTLLTGVGNLPSLGSININQLTSGLSNLSPANLNNLTATLNNLGKSSQFSMNFANPLSNLSNISLGGLQGQLTGAVGNLQGQLTGAVGNLQGQLTGAVGNLQGQLTSNIGRLTNLFSGSGDLVSGTQVAAGFNNTVNRATVDAAVTRILGNSKIPTPGFEYPSPASLAQKLDIAQAQSVLQGLKRQTSAVFGQAVTQFNAVNIS